MNNVSAVTAKNREFDDAEAIFNLHQDADKDSYYTKNDVFVSHDGATTTTTILKNSDLFFVEVPAEAVSDSLLGYKNLTNDELKVNKYTFNYWHPYATDKFIAKSDKDSTLTVKDGVSAFTLDTASRSANKSVYAVDKFGFEVKKEQSRPY